MVVEPPYDPDLDFHYRIFNADGSEVSQCGNGARCFARFVRLKGLTNKRDIRVSTANGRMVLSVTEDDLVRVNMGEPNFEPSRAVPRQQSGKDLYHACRRADSIVRRGVHGKSALRHPKLMMWIRQRWKLGPVMESHERFPERANIGFMQVVGRSHIRLRVYERGAGETQPAAAAPAPRWRWGSSRGCWRKRYAWNYPAVVLISPGKARASRCL